MRPCNGVPLTVPLYHWFSAVVQSVVQVKFLVRVRQFSQMHERRTTVPLFFRYLVLLENKKKKEEEEEKIIE